MPIEDSFLNRLKLFIISYGDCIDPGYITYHDRGELTCATMS